MVLKFNREEAEELVQRYIENSTETEK